MVLVMVKTNVQVVPRIICFKCTYDNGVGKWVGVLHISYLEHLFEAVPSLVTSQLYPDLVFRYNSIMPCQFSQSVIQKTANWKVTQGDLRSAMNLIFFVNCIRVKKYTLLSIKMINLLVISLQLLCNLSCQGFHPNTWHWTDCLTAVDDIIESEG